jgi:hypothetical protein
MALHERARRPVTPEAASPACVLLCSQASRGGPRVALNIFTAALLYAVSPELGAETAAALQTQKAPSYTPPHTSHTPPPQMTSSPRLTPSPPRPPSPPPSPPHPLTPSPPASAGQAVLAGLLFLCSTAAGRTLFEEEAAMVLLHEAVFGLVFANEIEARLHPNPKPDRTLP